MTASSHLSRAMHPRLQSRPKGIANDEALGARQIMAGSALHDKGLRVLEAKCDAEGADGQFLCQVTYLSISDPTQRLYFDIVVVARKGGEWELKSGLCKR